MGLLDGGVALVTGAASGIGRASALAFARDGAEGVVVSDVNVAGGEETVSLIKESGGDAIFVRCEVSKEAEVEALVQAAMVRYGRLDYAHNNAGSAPEPSLVKDITEAQWDRLMGIHLKGVWLCMKHEFRVMQPSSGCAVVNTASTAGIRGAALMAVYVAAKHGIIGLTKVAALENAEAGIRVNAICPGHTETPMHSETSAAAVATLQALHEIEVGAAPAPAPKRRTLGMMSRFADPSEQGEAVVWLCSPRASFVTGIALAVDGGQTAQL